MEIVNITNTEIKKRGESPSKQIILTGEGYSEKTAEIYSLPGVEANPPKNYKALLIPIAGKTSVAFGGCNYEIVPDTEKGGLKLYSTDSNGKSIKASILLKSDGKIKISNEQKSLATVLKNIVQHISSLTTTNAVQGAPCTLSPDTILNLNQDISDLAQLLEE